MKSDRCLPQYYKDATKVLTAFLECKGKIPQLVTTLLRPNDRRSHQVGSFLMRLQRDLDTIKSVVEDIGLLQKYKHFKPAVVYVIVGDLLLKGDHGKRFSSQNEYLTEIIRHKHELLNNYKNLLNEVPNTGAPRWAFINKLKCQINDIKQCLLNDGFQFVETSHLSYDKYLQAVKTIAPLQYMEDIHVPGMLAFHSSVSLLRSTLVQDGKLIIMDKASCLPPLLSGLQPGVPVMDACAAPGNKTIILANILKNKGNLLVVDMDSARFELLKSRLAAHGVKNARCLNKDFTSIPHSELEGIKIVLVDPSCSNSGLDIPRNAESASKDRLYKLEWVQYKLLKHALTIPGVQTVVYSTCSVHFQENEGVVARALLRFGDRFELENLSSSVPGWRHFGLIGVDSGNDCDWADHVLRTKPEVDLCHGFFVAKFVSKSASGEQCCNSLSNELSLKKSKRSDGNAKIDKNSHINMCHNDSEHYSKIKKKHHDLLEYDSQNYVQMDKVVEDAIHFEQAEPTSRKKRKRNCIENYIENNLALVTPADKCFTVNAEGIPSSVEEKECDHKISKIENSKQIRKNKSTDDKSISMAGNSIKYTVNHKHR